MCVSVIKDWHLSPLSQNPEQHVAHATSLYTVWQERVNVGVNDASFTAF